MLLKYPDTHLIILCPQKAVKAFKRELTQKLRVAYNELTSANKNINPNARITIVTHSMLKNNLDYISELKAEGKRLILIVDEAHCCDYDTLIQTNLGELKIGDIVTNKIKCKVFSYNEKLDLIEAKPIIDYFENECLEDMYEVEYVVKGKIKKVKLTGGHPVFTKNRGYVEVENLTTEDIILSVSNHCENCDKELNKYYPSFYNRRNKSNSFFCSRSCKTKYEHKNNIGCGTIDYKEVSKKISKTIKELYQEENSSLYIHRQRMIDNNPMKNKDAKEKMTNTLRKLSKDGKLKNNFKYGNGKMSESESLLYKDLSNLGFEYNKGIYTKEFKEKHPEMLIPFVYKVDFINKDLKIAIEIDGKSHNYFKVKEADRKKQLVYEYFGYRVLRFSNEEVINEKDKVMKEVITCIQKEE